MAVIINDNVISFATPTGQWQQPTHYALHPTASGFDPWATDTLSPRPARPASGDSVQFAVGVISIGITASNGLNDLLLKTMLFLGLSTSSHVSLHTGAPTADNELTSTASPGYARVSTSTFF